MTVASMTGFARKEGTLSRAQSDGSTVRWRWVWEVKSVNGRSLDVRFRLPAGLDALEAKVRAELPHHVVRGSLSIGLSLTADSGSVPLRLNEALLAQVLALRDRLAAEQVVVEPLRLEGLLALRGMLEPVEPTAADAEQQAAQEALQIALFDDCRGALKALGAARLAEGTRLAGIALGHLDQIAELVAEARAVAETQPTALRDRLRAQLTELLGSAPPLSEERLAQEMALVAGKADIREELDRLDAHVSQARDYLTQSGAIGRKLDFLCQEFNREANTMCSKSADLGLTRTGLALKAAIEQLREQVQNIE